MLFWIIYLPLSALASELNWNGLFEAEPRWRMAVIFAITGALLQVGIYLIQTPRWGSAINAGFAAVLYLALNNTPRVMHPESPIFSSDSSRIQVFFIGLLLLCLTAALQIAVLFLRMERKTAMPTKPPGASPARSTLPQD